MPDPLSLLNLIISIALVVGGFVAYKHGFARTANEVQERVIHALESEIQALHDRISALEQENTRLNQTITTICSALKQRGIHVTIDGDIVHLHDITGNEHLYTTRIYSTETVKPSQEKDVQQLPSEGPAVRKRGKKHTPVRESTAEEGQS